jgi:formamidopyrimidine-DNA glycosylase
MPELPDLLYVQARLRERLLGRTVIGERLREPVVLRCTVRGNLSLLLGQTLQDVHRHAHFLVFRFEHLDLAVNPMLAGRFRLCPPSDKDEPALCFALRFDAHSAATDGERSGIHSRAASGGGPSRGGRDAVSPPLDDLELRYVDDKKMGKAYLTATGDANAIPGFAAVGLDVLSVQFSRERFVSVLKHRRDQVRVFLLDKRALDSIGNAYADEVLFEAGLHPKTWCRQLSHEDAVRLHDAIVTVMREAVAEVERRAQPIEVKVRDFLKVRLRDVCPRCGTRIRKAGVRGMDAYFCPHCQPATREGLVDWNKTDVQGGARGR